DPNVSAFAKTSLPNCDPGEILTSDGSSLSCVTDTGGASAWTAVDATTSAKGIVSVPASGGLSVTDGEISLPDQSLTPGSFTKVTVDQKGRVTAGGAITEADLPDFSSAGKVSGDAINSGTISG